MYKDLYGKPCKRNWVAKVVFLIQMLLTFGGCCSRYFWEAGLKTLRSPNFNMLFQLVLTKFFKSELFSCLPKVGHVIKSCKEPIVHQFLELFAQAWPPNWCLGSLSLHLVMPWWPSCNLSRTSSRVDTGITSWLSFINKPCCTVISPLSGQ